MDPQQFADQIAQTEERFRDRAPQRAETKARIMEGGALAADTPERLARRLERLEVESDVVESVVAERAGNVVFAEASPAPEIDERSALVLERLLGNNDLIGVGFLEAGYLAGRAVGRISVMTADGRAFGTGSLISPRLMMTNNHVLKTAALAATARVEFDYQRGLDGADLPAVAFAFDPDAFFLTNKHLDYTLVAVAQSAGTRELGEFGFNQLIEAEGKVLLGEAVNIIQHPSGEPKQLALRENKLVDLIEDFVHYETDTAPGSSGSPVFNDQWELVALHHSGVPKKDGQDRILALGGGLWQKSMGETQIDWVANEGARVSRIVADLKQQNLSGRQRTLRADVFEAAPERPVGGASNKTATTRSAAALPVGAVTMTVPLKITVMLGTPEAASPAVAAKPAASPAAAPGLEEPELATALAELERGRRRPYYSEARDRVARQSYYAEVTDELDDVARYRLLNRLVTETHKLKPAYKPSRLVYPWVDLHPDRSCVASTRARPLMPSSSSARTSRPNRSAASVCASSSRKRR